MKGAETSQGRSQTTYQSLPQFGQVIFNEYRPGSFDNKWLQYDDGCQPGQSCNGKSYQYQRIEQLVIVFHGDLL